VDKNGLPAIEQHPFFCCCAGDNCNANVTLTELDGDETSEEFEHENEEEVVINQESSDTESTVVWVTLVIVMGFVFFVFVILTQLLYRRRLKPNKDDKEDEANLKLIHPIKMSNSSWELEKVGLSLGDEISKKNV